VKGRLRFEDMQPGVFEGPIDAQMNDVTGDSTGTMTNGDMEDQFVRFQQGLLHVLPLR
jgi:hypothetical protein